MVDSSVKGQIVNTLGFEGRIVPVVTTQLCWYRRKSPVDNLEINVWLYFVLDAEIWISYNFHVSKYYSYFEFFQSFANIKTNPSLWTMQLQMMGWTWPLAVAGVYLTAQNFTWNLTPISEVRRLVKSKLSNIISR